MTEIIRCDKCGKLMEVESMRATLELKILNVPGGSAQTPFGPIQTKRRVVQIWKDLCDDCARELCGLLDVEALE